MKWSDSWLHIFSLRNMLFNLVHLILRVVYHPEGEAFAPCKTLENMSEHHFSQKKMLSNSSPSIASCIYATQKAHMQQLMQPFKPKSVPTSTGCTMEMASNIMHKAFHIASKVESITSVGVTPSSLRAKLMKYIGKIGVSMFFLILICLG